MTDTLKETTLAESRLHWGIFVLPFLVLAALVVVTLPAVFIFRAMQNSLVQVSPQAARPFGGLLILLFVLPEILIGLPLLLVVWSAYLKSNITLTDRRLIYRTGLLARMTGELPLKNVEAIILAEPLMGRLLGYGTVIVTSLGGLRFPLRYLPTPVEFHALLQETVHAAKSSARPASKVTPPPTDDDSRYMPKG